MLKGIGNPFIGTMKTDNEKIKIPILVPLAIAILALLGTFVAGIYWLRQQYIIKKDVQTHIGEVENLFREHLEEYSRLLNAVTDFLKDDKNLQAAWLAKDRDSLFAYAEPIFKNIHDKYGITHFYFHDTDKSCFLRVHDPPHNGDRIDRYTLDKAFRDAQPSCGIELGPLGLFTLRCVHPWYINGKLTGFIELGEEITEVMPDIKKMLPVELFFIIKKPYLNRESWEHGMKLMGQQGNWDLLADFVIIDRTLKQIPSQFPSVIAQNRTAGADKLFEMRDKNRAYYTGFVRLLDVAGRETGHIVVMKDVRESEIALHKLLAILISISIIIGGTLLVFFHLYIHQIEDRLTTSYALLKVEIEKRRQTEEGLRHARDELEFRVEERTVELNSTVKKLEIANTDLLDLIRVAAHDLKAPLRAIGVIAEWLMTDYGDKLDRAACSQINTLSGRVTRMSNHIDGIVRYAAIGHTPTSKEAVNLNLLVKEVLDTVCAPENIEISAETTLPTILCEKSYIGQIFHNLLTNAIEYMDKPHGFIKIGCTEDNGFWKFSVADNGPGIEEKYFEKIFQVFQTLARRDEHEATGLGLSTVKKIVELYDGKVWVESRPGIGSTFFFTLPKQPDSTINNSAIPVPALTL